MRALTVQQPWAWAIVHGGKDVENRTQAWKYRGPLAIHAGARCSDRGLSSPLVVDAWNRHGYPDQDNLADVTWPAGGGLSLGAIIGVVDLVDVHRCVDSAHDLIRGGRVIDCCWSEWAQLGGVHLELVNPRPLAIPIPCRGALGLWTPPADVLALLQAVAS